MSDCLNRPSAEPVDTAECDCREGERCADPCCVSRADFADAVAFVKANPRYIDHAPAQERAPVYAAEWGGGNGWGHPVY